MFFDRENEPDLGDERFRREVEEGNSNCHTSSNSYYMSFSIPIEYYNMSKEELTQIFQYFWGQEIERQTTIQRIEKIKNLKIELEKLEAEHESKNH